MPHDRQLIGHSDADVLLHAMTDALLGAVALPDIGRLFPNTDEANRGRDSAEMLAIATAKLAEVGYRVVNLDCVVPTPNPRRRSGPASLRTVNLNTREGDRPLRPGRIGIVGVWKKTTREDRG